MSDLRARALDLARRAELASDSQTVTEQLADLLDDLTDLVRTAGDWREHLDRWQLVNGYIFERTREDCADILGGQQ